MKTQANLTFKRFNQIHQIHYNNRISGENDYFNRHRKITLKNIHLR